MTTIRKIIILAGIVFAFTSCSDNKSKFDASGSFEAEETIISAEVSGQILQFNIEEGQNLQVGQVLGYVDSTQLFLKKKQLDAHINALASRKPNVSVQLSSLEQQLKTAEIEKIRISNLIKGDAATTKQLDDIKATIEVLRKQIDAQKSSLNISTESLSKDAIPLQIQIDQINDQLGKCKIVNPVKGTVLSKYSQVNEMTAPGKALYKIADLSNIILRVFVSGNQMASVKLNQRVTVCTDDGNGGTKETEGTITWINDKAEFTPKTIQTKDERANMVYAIKVRVANDGTYKIGMYGEIKFK